MTGLSQLHSPVISLNGQDYQLARQQVLERAGRARSWQVERIRITEKQEPRSDVQQGTLPDEYVITLDDWSSGVWGDHSAPPGTAHISDGINHSAHGRLRVAGRADIPFIDGTNMEGDAAGVIEFNNTQFTLNGRRITNLGGSTDKDFGAGNIIKDAIVHNNELVVGFGGSTKKIETRNTSGTWTEATDAVYADYFARVESRLWRATATNEVSNIGPTDNPLTLANWSAGITVGDDDTPITDLNGVNERIVVSKETGFHLGDAAAIFPNIFPQLENQRDADNGKNTLVVGSTAYYPHRDGLIKWTIGEPAEEIGLQEVFTTGDPSLTDPVLTGLRITAMVAQGRYLWAATAPGYFPRADPTGFRKTTDNEVSFTNYTTEVGDNDADTVAQLGSLDTAANGDYFYVGYSSNFLGVFFSITEPNINTATLAIQYWNGTAWASLPADSQVKDHTSLGGITLRRSGLVSWREAPSDWANNTIDGTSARWIRFNVSAALSGGLGVTIQEARVVLRNVVSIWRARPREPGDATSKSMTWHSFFQVGQHGEPVQEMTGMAINRVARSSAGATLIGVGRQYYWIQELDREPTDPPVIDYQDTFHDPSIWLPKHDGGFPSTNKLFRTIIQKGKNQDATTGYLVAERYRLDEVTTIRTFVNTISDLITTNLTANNQGRAISLNAQMFGTGKDALPELYEIDIVFRLLPTYKNVYTCILELSDSQPGQAGALLAPASVQLDNLEDLTGAAPFVMIDALGRRVGGASGNVTMSSLRELEYVQEGLDYPVLAVEVILAEV